MLVDPSIASMMCRLNRLVRNGAIASARPTGNAIVPNHLGWIYAVCRGVPADYAEAEKWFRKAAAQGVEEAKDALRRLDVSQRRRTKA